MKILLVNVGAESNKGTSAITIGTIRLLKKLFPEISIKCLSMYQGLTSDSYISVQKTFPEIEFLDNVCPLRTSFLLKTFECIKVWFLDGKCYLDHPSVRVIRESDLIIARSSPIFQSKSSLLNYSAARASIPLYIAAKLGKSYGFAPQTFWPIRGLQARKIIIDLGQKASFIFARDVFSFGELCHLGLKPILSLDNAFWIEPTDNKWEEVSSKLDLAERNFIVIVPRLTKNQKTDDMIYKRISYALKHIVPDIVSKIVLVQHNLVEDKEAIKTLHLQLTLMGLEKSTLILDTSKWSPEEIAGFYGLAKALVGMRVHSAIMALVPGTPVIGIDIDGRMQAILKTIGLESQVISHLDNNLADVIVKNLACKPFSLKDYIYKKKLCEEEKFYKLIKESLT